MAAPIYKLLRDNKEWLISWPIIIAIVFLVIHFWPQPPSPVPAQIRSEAGFTLIYPQGYSISPSSWKYLRSEQVVEFTATQGSSLSVIFTEQQTPLEYQNDVAAYDRFIGSLRPRANFTVPFGTVSIANFVTAGSYEVVGESGILNTNGTFLVVHPGQRQPSDDQWRSLFESLKVDQ